ncbi:iron chelate uptake ABC transporter family permease subunit [Pseudonocardia sp. TRM90224]|uniref:iron chelate uptake ABC transporter family permease subunit n=1 Tax=Pseudonocardia sp. TRM90224 TaxID=2812678 RepID=UPI001E329203|nr:iron chelate uptake ABC transporter family permease subunit [Pseudonocardia sp. TRM90224]
MTATLTRPARATAVRKATGVALLPVAVVALCGAAALSLLVGNQPVTAAQVVASFTDFAQRDSDLIVRYLRVPRTVAGLLAGCALGLAGGVVQGLTRNPLADPGILGVNAGAALAAVIAYGWFGISSLTGYVWFAFVGAAGAAVVVYAAGSVGRGGATPVKLAMAGAAVAALLGSVTSGVTLLNSDTFELLRFWVIGSLSRADLPAVLQATPFVAAGAALAFGLGRALNAVALGDEMASTLGVSTVRVRTAAAVAVVVLAGAATAVAGPIAFIGLVAPHLARLVAGSDHRLLLPWSAVLGATIVLVADVVGRVVVPPEEVQVGVTAAVVGAPVLLYLVRRRQVARL